MQPCFFLRAKTGGGGSVYKSKACLTSRSPILHAHTRMHNRAWYGQFSSHFVPLNVTFTYENSQYFCFQKNGNARAAFPFRKKHRRKSDNLIFASSPPSFRYSPGHYDIALLPHSSLSLHGKDEGPLFFQTAKRTSISSAYKSSPRPSTKVPKKRGGETFSLLCVCVSTPKAATSRKRERKGGHFSDGGRGNLV